MDKYKFGEFIYQRRKALKLTQEELGRKIGVTNKAVSKWEVGETTPDITILHSLASILEVSVDELLTQEVKKEKEEQKIKINKLFVLLTIILGALNILILGVVIGGSIYNKHKEYNVTLDSTNYNEIINIDPMINFVCDGQGVKVTSSYGLDNKYYLKENMEILFVITFEITYYYLDSNDNLCLITYYARTKEVVLDSTKSIDFDEIELQPKHEITDFKCFKNISVTYNIEKYSGEVYIVK